MSNLTQKLKTVCLAIIAFCLTATSCAMPQFSTENSVNSSSHTESQTSLEDSVDGSSSQEESDSDSTTDVDSESSSAPDKDTPTEEQLRAEEIMNQAYALPIGATLDGIQQLSGTVSYVDIDYTSKNGVCLYFDVDEPQQRELYCYKLKGTGAELIDSGSYITVSGTLKNYKGMIEFEKPTLIAYTLADGSQGELPDVNSDPYKNTSKTEFYANYTPATSNEDAYYRSLHGFMSGELTVPDQAPTLSDYRPKQGTAYIRNEKTVYEEDGNAYVVTDVYGNEAFTVYRDGGYITLEEVAAYVYAFGTYPKNYTTSKNTDPDDSVWDEYLRLNHTAFSGDTDRYPYEPELPNISGCGGSLRYYEMDIGTTGTDCNPSYPIKIYNDGNSITRGAARIVYGKTDLDKDGVFEAGEWHVFYTYNHYNDFQEYLNYAGGWGETFGNITGGGTLSSSAYFNPTDYVPVYFGDLPTVNTRTLFQRYFA